MYIRTYHARVTFWIRYENTVSIMIEMLRVFNEFSKIVEVGSVLDKWFPNFIVTRSTINLKKKIAIYEICMYLIYFA